MKESNFGAQCTNHSANTMCSIFSFGVFCFSCDKDAISWNIETAHSQHRLVEVTGWMCIPKSVVMATALNLKHLQRLERGKPLTILNSSRKATPRPLSNKTLTYIQCQNITKSREEKYFQEQKPCCLLIKPSLYSRYYAETYNGWRVRFPPISAWATQLYSKKHCNGGEALATFCPV